MADVIKIGALISGTGTNLRAIIDACKAGKLAGEVVFIGSDNPQAAGLKLGRRHGIPTFVFDYRAIIRSSRDSLSGSALPLDVNLNELLAKQN
ncbi:MAG: formyltransferase family protein, partial [Desulfobacterales bacterium]